MRQMVESDIKKFQILRDAGRVEEANKMLMGDATACVEGINATMEVLFLSGLSTGYATFTNADDDKAVRVNFGYKVENKIPATAIWSDASNSKPLDDIENLVSLATKAGVRLTTLFVSKKYMNYLRNSEQCKVAYANNAGITATSVGMIARLSEANMSTVLKDEFGVDVVVVDSSIRMEDKSGKHTTITPWAEANVVGVTTSTVGRIVYGTLAEDDAQFQNKQADYAKNGPYTLVTKWADNGKPHVEYTSAEALAIPVIDNADEVFVLYADRTALLSLSETSFDVANKSKELAVKFTSELNVTAVSADSWATCTVDNEKDLIVINVAANSGAARTTTITVSDEEGTQSTITISQKAGA